MRGDFEIIRHSFPRKDIKVIPIADVHLGAVEHMAKEWESFCNGVGPDTYLMLIGDLIDNGIKTSIANPYEQTMRPREQKQRMVEMLAPLRDKILCIIPGNHEQRNRDVDDDPTYDIACKLDLEDVYRENIAFLKLQFGRQDWDGGKNPTYSIACAHGNGSSIYTGAANTRAERFGMAIDGIDMLCTGHTHKPMDYPVGKLSVDLHNNKVSIKPFRMVVATSWLDYSAYAIKKLLVPTVHQRQEILLAGGKKEIRVTQ